MRRGSPPLSPQRGDDVKPGFYTSDPTLYGLLKEFVKENKTKSTPAEMALWKYLRENMMGVHFRRQHIIGPYIADFVCLSKKLVIELDGGYHQLPQQQANDEARSLWLASKGYKVIRFKNENVLGDMETVLNTIKKQLDE
ncbi:MAG: endonuclease domain-containing protein [Prevotella sp.]|nr:endonuclease domain-containing protein [Prevotella sp.]